MVSDDEERARAKVLSPQTEKRATEGLEVHFFGTTAPATRVNSFFNPPTLPGEL